MADNLRVLNTQKPDPREEFVGHLEKFLEQIKNGDEPIPDVMIMYTTTRGYSPHLYATGTKATPLGVLAAADLCHEAAVVYATQDQYEGDSDG